MGANHPQRVQKKEFFFGDQKTGVKLLGVLLPEVGFEPMRSLAHVMVRLRAWTSLASRHLYTPSILLDSSGAQKINLTRIELAT